MVNRAGTVMGVVIAAMIYGSGDRSHIQVYAQVWTLSLSLAVTLGGGPRGLHGNNARVRQEHDHRLRTHGGLTLTLTQTLTRTLTLTLTPTLTPTLTLTLD